MTSTMTSPNPSTDTSPTRLTMPSHSTSELAERLRATTLLRDFGERDLRIVARHVEHLRVAADTPLIRRGDPATNVFFVLEGHVSVRGAGDEWGLTAGGHVGELALLRRTPSHLDADASTACELAVLGARMFHVLCRDLPPFNRALLANLAEQAVDLDRSRAAATPFQFA